MEARTPENALRYVVGGVVDVRGGAYLSEECNWSEIISTWFTREVRTMAL